jgi:phosphoglycolate phosphatase
MKFFELVIFDLDGTIVDSGQTVLRLINSIRRHLNMPIMEFSEISKVLSLGGRKLIETALGPAVNSQEYLEHFRALYLNDSLVDEELYPGFLEYLHILKKNKIKTAICSNKPSQLVEKVLTHHKIGQHFDFTLADNGLFPKKPSPEGLLQILNWAQIDPKQAILVGDSRIDQLAASSAGVQFAFHQSGYDDGVWVDNTNFCFNTYYDLIGQNQ